MLEDALPQVLLGPQRQRVVLVDAALLVLLDKLGISARGALLSSDARDPTVAAGERTLERGYLGDRAAMLGAGPRGAGVTCVVDLYVYPEALLECLPGLQRLSEQDASVDRRDSHGRLAVTDAQELIDQDRLLLLEGAQQYHSLAVALDRLAQGLAKTARELLASDLRRRERALIGVSGGDALDCLERCVS